MFLSSSEVLLYSSPPGERAGYATAERPTKISVRTIKETNDVFALGVEFIFMISLDSRSVEKRTTGSLLIVSETNFET